MNSAIISEKSARASIPPWLSEEPCELLERLQIFGHPFLDVGALHFDRHEPPVAQRCPVNLAERRGRNRLRFEQPEAFRQPHAELCLDDALDLFE